MASPAKVERGPRALGTAIDGDGGRFDNTIMKNPIATPSSVAARNALGVALVLRERGGRTPEPSRSWGARAQDSEKVGVVVQNIEPNTGTIWHPMEIEKNIEHRKKNSEILVVEDSLTQAKRLERLLKENGYSVRLARNGLEGLDWARKARPAVVITDVMKTEMDGYEM